MNSRRHSKDFELVFERLDAMDRRLEQLNRPQSNVVGFLDFIARLATCPPRTDGHLQFSEVLTGMALVGGSWVVGAFGSWVTSDPELMRFTVRIGCYGCLALWALDVVNPAGIWDETVGRALDAFGERLAELAHDAPDRPKVRLVPVYSAAGKPKRVTIESLPEPDEYDLPDDRTISVPDLVDFMTTAARMNDWTRDNWMKRGMEKPTWYALREELRRLKVWGVKGDSPALWRFVRSLTGQGRTGRDGRDGTGDDDA